ncbi:FliH/SctL family protein [Hippea alviniae]|uniref:FliH/SctL family protein n=1 Tax=Hippea alviniae TaxID=1279027 RepID=UPI0003B5C793|nr:FliH/SctL family protein [Hippea alviniae]
MPIEVEEFVFEDFDDEGFESEELEKHESESASNSAQTDSQGAKNNQENQEQAIAFDKEEIKRQLQTIIETTKQEALKEAQLIKEQAKKEGFELGYKEGYEKGLKDAKGIFDKTIEEYTAKMQQAIAKLIDTAAEISRRYEELENAATDMVLQIAKKVIAGELVQNKDAINNMVKEALGIVESDKIKLKMHPDDAKNVNISSLGSNKNIEIVEDDKLSKGSLIIEEANGNVIDASVDTKLKQIKGSLVNE